MSSEFQPAARVIKLCGGISATARIIGRHRSTVNRWLLSRETGGTAGRIPMRHAEKLLAVVDGLRPEDVICVEAD